MQDVELSLRDYIGLFLRRWWIIALAIAVCLLGAVLYTARQTPQYRSSANILINQSSASDLFDPVTGGQTTIYRGAENEARLLTSGLVSDVAIAELGYVAYVSAEADTFADILLVTAVSTDPMEAQEIVQTYAESYLQVRQDRFRSQRLDTAAKLEEQLALLDAQIETATGDELVRLQLQRRDLADSSDLLSRAVQLADDTGATIIDEATLPGSPFTPRVRRNLLLGIVLGAMSGVGLVLLREVLDNSVKSREILESLTPGAPTLAIIPSLGRSPERRETLVSLNATSSSAAEAFRTLRAALQYVAVDASVRVIQISSAHSSAGKTTVAANLAVTLAASGQSVAVVDGDLRKPRINQLFGVSQVPGLTSAIIGAAPLRSVVQPVSGVSSLVVIPSGPIPPGPAELLGSAASARIFEEIRELVDVVIVDTPPVLAIADTMIMSRYVDASILVVDAKKTNRADVRAAYDRLVQSGAPVVGTVLNRAAGGGPSGYGYGYRTDGAGLTGWFGRRDDASGVQVLNAAEIPSIEVARSSASGNGSAGQAAPARPVSNQGRAASAATATQPAPKPTRAKSPTPARQQRPVAQAVNETANKTRTPGWADQIILRDDN